MIWKSFEGVIEPDSAEAQLLERIDPDSLPIHVAIIMDGNGRWAKARNLPRIEGHKAGTDSVKQVIETAARLGVRYLTLYAFSVENWKRPKTEVQQLMRLLKHYLKNELGTLLKHDIRLRAIGRLDEMEGPVRHLLRETAARTAKNRGLQLSLALNYGGRTELVDAVRAIARQVHAGALAPEQIDVEHIARNLYTDDIPDPDLLIRTSGEYRLSNFLLWQIAYTEFYITPTLWPDFRQRHLLEAVLDFQKRERRFGGLAGERSS